MAKQVPPLVALEEHFLSSTLLSSVESSFSEQFKYIPGAATKLQDLDQIRLDDMNANQISFQIISHTAIPGSLSPQVCREANDQLAAAVSAHPTRFAGFATLPMAHPSECATELERAVTQHGFVGALIDNHVHGKYFDGPEYDVFWAKAESLDVPIYLHPTWPSDDMVATQYSGNFSAGATRSLGASGWGWHSETGLHVLRLYAAGLFDRFPKLKLVIGHMGEMIPFQLQRICNLSVRWGDQQRKLKQVWEENIWVTTSGVWSLDPLRCLLGNTKVERILFSVDWPFEKNENGLKWMRELQESGLVTEEQCEMIAFKNAQTLFGVTAPAR